MSPAAAALSPRPARSLKPEAARPRRCGAASESVGIASTPAHSHGEPRGRRPAGRPGSMPVRALGRRMSLQARRTNLSEGAFTSMTRRSSPWQGSFKLAVGLWPLPPRYSQVPYIPHRYSDTRARTTWRVTVIWHCATSFISTVTVTGTFELASKEWPWPAGAAGGVPNFENEKTRMRLG